MWRHPTVVVVLSALVVAGCSDRIVFRERELLADLPAGANGFVGYSNEQTQLTVCGNCHITHQNRWIETAHANAFGAADALAPAQAELCAVCHGVSHIGNDATQPGGWMTVRTERYHDVQCESCHGPGEAHVRNPDGGTVGSVLARVNAGPDMNGTCMECHSGFHHPFVEEWAASGHGGVLESPAGRSACAGCHEGKAALDAFGVQAAYEERGTTGHIAITCAVCHDPHRSTHEGQLRFSIRVPDEEQNLCMRCHHKRGGPDFTAQNRGPHSPEGPMLLGEAGWWPPDMPIQPGTLIVGTHGSEANPRMCAGCHMQQFDAPDEATGSITIPTTGHLFEAIPCLDAAGLPVREDTCAFEQRTFRTCTGSGCHGSENAARSAMLVVRQRINAYIAGLNAQLAAVPASEFDPNDNRYTTAEGARFNAQLGARSGSAVHNPFLMEALLIGSIQQVQKDYGVASSIRIDFDAELTRILRSARVTHSTEE